MTADARPHPAAIVVENLAPLVGVLFFGWSLAPVMVVYWVENGLRGLETAARMLLASGGVGPAAGAATEARGTRGGLGSRLALTGFFLVHYGIFWAVHGLFVFTLFVGIGPSGGFGRPGAAGVPTGEVALAAGLIAATLAGALIRDARLPGGLRHASAGELMTRAYGRVMVLHAAILVGGFALMLLGSPTPALVLLIALKTAAELASCRGRRRPADRGDAP